MEASTQKDLSIMYSEKEVKPLNDLYDIETAVLLIKELNHKIDIQKGYKERKVEAIKAEIQTLESQVEFYETVIIKTLQEHKEKNLTLPDVCKVSLRKPTSKWVIDNEEDFKEVLKDENELSNITEPKTEVKIIKKAADKLLDMWEKSEKLPGCVHKENGETSLMIKYLDEPQDNHDDVADVIPSKADFDNL